MGESKVQGGTIVPEKTGSQADTERSQERSRIGQGATNGSAKVPR